MEPKDLLLPLVAALWACGTLVFTVARELNSIRDKVLTGHDGCIELSKNHLQILIANDWRPLSFAIVFLTFIFAAIACISPMLVRRQQRSRFVWIIAAFVAAYSAFMALAWFWGASSDLQAMRAAIEGR